MATKGFILYLISGFSVAILAAIFITNPNSNLSSTHNSKIKVILATVIGFFGSAFGTVGGVGGGGIFVPICLIWLLVLIPNLLLHFLNVHTPKSYPCMIMGASTSSVWYNLRVPHPTKEVPIIDYDLALLFQPMLMLVITFGVALSVVFPFWLITILIIILFVGTSSRSFVKGIQMWKQETILNVFTFSLLTLCFYCVFNVKQQEAQSNSVHIDVDYDLLVPQEEKSGLNFTKDCCLWYWVLNFMQIPVALVVYGFEAVKLYKESKERRMNGNMESVCEATIQWSALQLGFCAFAGFLGGTVGGLLGSGGGFILGPLLLELGVIPQVASATATFVMMFSSSLSVIEFYLLGRFPIPYALFLIAVSIAAGFWGQFFVRKLVAVLKRASIIVFILSAVIFTSALIMGVAGIEKSLYMIHNHEYMGFLRFCK
ncbi:hypothetical protein MKX01_040765 [Papaver californicum]|nr:hypothetical protein MKX01_040765 [Papaver californicum]